MYNGQTIVLHLVKSLMTEAVKAETFIRSKIDKSVNDGADKVAYNEAAGDDEYHERKLARCMATGLAEVKTWLSDFLTESSWTSGDNVVVESEDIDTDHIDLTLHVSRRFNNSYVDSLAKLVSKCVEDIMLVDWFATFNAEQANVYRAAVEQDKIGIRRCFNKTAPRVPKTPYTTQITLTGTTVGMAPGEVHDVTYSIDDDCIDDVEALTSDHRIVTTERHHDGSIYLRARHTGVAKVLLVSKHNDSVRQTLRVKVAEDYKL